MWPVTVFVAALAAACSPGDEASVVLLGEAGLPSDSESTRLDEELDAEATAASTGSSSADFDSLLLFPLLVQTPGLDASLADCDFDNEPFSSCL